MAKTLAFDDFDCLVVGLKRGDEEGLHTRTLFSHSSATRMLQLCCRSIKCLKNQIFLTSASEGLYGARPDRKPHSRQRSVANGSRCSILGEDGFSCGLSNHDARCY